LDNADEQRNSKRQRTPKRGQKGVQFSRGKVCRFQAKKTVAGLKARFASS
jgi:hypothetical protein